MAYIEFRRRRRSGGVDEQKQKGWVDSNIL